MFHIIVLLMTQLGGLTEWFLLEGKEDGVEELDGPDIIIRHIFLLM